MLLILFHSINIIIIIRTPDEQLVWYLLQLVQALRYEPDLQGDRLPNNISEYSFEACPSPLARFLISKSTQSLTIANYFHWYLTVAMEDKRFSNLYEYVHQLFLLTLDESESGQKINRELMLQGELVGKCFSLAQQLQDFGGKAAKKQEKLIELLNGDMDLSYPSGACFPLMPNCYVVGVNQKKAKVFKSALSPFALNFFIDTNRVPAGYQLSYFLDRGKEADKCCDCDMKFNFCICTKCTSCEKNVVISDKHHCRLCGCTLCDTCFNKDKKVCLIIPECEKRRKPAFPVMVKLGDDVRQDQLVIQMIILMDQLLKNVNLNLYLTPYKVLAFSSNQGMIEFVRNSIPLSGIVDIQVFLRTHNPDPAAEYGIDAHAMDVYVRSCAGYCVINYLLSIGDRHLDNLMMTVYFFIFI